MIPDLDLSFADGVRRGRITAMRMWLPISLIAVLVLVGCKRDETVTALAGVGSVWRLSTLDGREFAATATLELPEPGRISGSGPCNRYGADQTAPWPWFALGPIVATRRACADLAAETAFLTALAAMTEVEVAGYRMILRNREGGEMVFQRDPG